MRFNGRADVVEKVKELIQNRLNQVDIEENKVEIKRGWPNLKDKKELNEWLKDVSAMANTYGLDGLIIYGLDEKESKLIDAPFKDSGLRDKADLPYVLSRHLSSSFLIDVIEVTIEEKKITVLHIPPTKNKPIVVKNYLTFDKQGNERSYEHKIFARYASGIRTASKSDIDLMYYDNSNIAPDYELEVVFENYAVKRKFDFDASGEIIDESASIVIQFLVENVGRRPVVIKDIIFWFVSIHGTSMDFTTHEVKFNKTTEDPSRLKIPLLSGNILALEAEFFSNSTLSYEDINAHMKFGDGSKNLMVRTNKGIAFYSTFD